ncbi:MAG: LolA family protein [Terriglobales bacterium]
MRKSLTLTALSIFLLSNPAGAVSGDDGGSAFEQPASILAGSKQAENGEPLLQSMIERVHQIPGYVFQSNLTTYESSGKRVIETGKLYFKAPDLLRFEVEKAGRRSGSVVVRDQDGKVRGEMGGLLSAIHLTLSPDSSMLKSANGFSVLESDFASLLSYAKEHARGNVKCLVGESPDRTTIVELCQDDGSVAERIEIDAVEKLPKRWALFNNNKLFSEADFVGLEIKKDLPDTLFSLGEGRGAKDFDEWTANEVANNLAPLLPHKAGQRLTASALVEATHLMDLLMDSYGDTMFPVKVTSDSANPQQSRWMPKGREEMLMAVTKQEQILSILAPFGPAIRSGTTATEKEEAALADRWDALIKSSLKSLSIFVAAIDDENPDAAALNKALQSLQDQYSELDTLLKKQAKLL